MGATPSSDSDKNEQVRALVRSRICRLLKKYRYPPDKQEASIAYGHGADRARRSRMARPSAVTRGIPAPGAPAAGPLPPRRHPPPAPGHPAGAGLAFGLLGAAGLPLPADRQRPRRAPLRAHQGSAEPLPRLALCR